jgi:ATP-dependent protease ClpP protease subunit
MPTPDPNYRINDARSVFITGPINQELIDRLTPRIRTLRAENSQPISVYIDSIGGSTRLSAVLVGLLRCSGQDARSPRIITVVTSSAHSAAADLLASGDYAIAYPEAVIHYHGTRRYFDEGITVEAAQSLADDLEQANALFAIRLAERSIERFMFLFLCERSGFPKVRERLGMPNLPDVDTFGAVLRDKLSPSLRRLPARALEDFREARALTSFIFKRLKFQNRDWGRVEVDMFRDILNYELRRNKGRNWTLTGGGLAKAVSDFLMVNDFTFGRQRQYMRKFVERRWRLFVSEIEQRELEANFSAMENGQEALLKHLEQRMEPLWHFVYSLCKRLQESENTLTAFDAYWLGIVDEVLGVQLPCIRELVEAGPQSADAATQSASPPAASPT